MTICLIPINSTCRACAFELTQEFESRPVLFRLAFVGRQRRMQPRTKHARAYMKMGSIDVNESAYAFEHRLASCIRSVQPGQRNGALQPIGILERVYANCRQVDLPILVNDLLSIPGVVRDQRLW